MDRHSLLCRDLLAMKDGKIRGFDCKQVIDDLIDDQELAAASMDRQTLQGTTLKIPDTDWQAWIDGFQAVMVDYARQHPEAPLRDAVAAVCDAIRARGSMK